MNTRLNLNKNYRTFFNFYIGDAILGSVDGVITTFAVISGAVGANISSGIIIVIASAGLLAESFSMGISNYLGTKSFSEVTENKNRNSLIAGIVTFIFFIVLGIMPLTPYLFNLIININLDSIFLSSIIITILTFIVIGIFRAYFSQIRKIQAILETLGLGIIASLIAYSVGMMLKNLV